MLFYTEETAIKITFSPLDLRLVIPEEVTWHRGLDWGRTNH